MDGLAHRARTRLNQPVDGASLVVFRAGFGSMVLWEMSRYYAEGRIARYWIDPEVFFPYSPLTFVRPWPWPSMMYAHVAVVALAALAVAVGYRYRLATVVLWCGFTWLFLIDQTRYLNHFYLISLLSFVLMWLPLGRIASLDAWSGRVAPLSEVPGWCLGWVRFMVAVPYVFGGVAKLTPDWLRGFPMREWLAEATAHPFVGGLGHSELVVGVFVWGGILFDLLIVPALLWSRTRVVALALMLAFHLSNAEMFSIGIFPWTMILLTLVLLPPDWPRRLWDDLRVPTGRGLAAAAGALGGFVLGTCLGDDPSPVEANVAAIGFAVLAWDVAGFGWDRRRPAHAVASEPVPMALPAFLGVALFVGIQVVVPLRHFLIPGNVHWTEQGSRWAWHMLLRDKSVASFTIVVDPVGDAPPFEVDPKAFLRKHQYKKVACHPEMNVALARYVVEKFGVPGAAVYVRSGIAMSGRRPATLIDPAQDLTTVAMPWFAPAPWILPLDEPLPETTRGSVLADD